MGSNPGGRAGWKWLNLPIDPGTRRRLKVAAALRGTTMSGLMNRILVEYLDRQVLPGDASPGEGPASDDDRAWLEKLAIDADIRGGG